MTTLDKEAVLDACDGRWPDFYGQFTELHREGSQFVGACPIHQGTNPNFKVNADDGTWYCHSVCQEGGDGFTFLEKQEGLRFGDALLRLAQWAGMAVPEPGTRSGFVPIRKPPAPTAPAPPVFLDPALAQQAHMRLMNSPKMRDWLLAYRGWTEETLVRFQIGLAQDDRDKAAGVFRVTFPVFDAEGRLTNLRRHLFPYLPSLTEERRRELNKSLPWQAGLTPGLFPLRALEGGQEVLLVGGEPDAVLANQLGIAALTGTSGEGTWKPGWTQALQGHCVAVLYDNDEAGEKGVKKTADALHAAGVCVSVARYPEGVKDLTEWVVTQGAGAEDLRRVIADALPLADAPQTPVPSSAKPDPWEPPLPFGTSTLPAFPVEALPDALGGYVSEVAATTQVPPDMAALLALAVVASAGGRRCQVQIGRTHSEPLNLFCAVVMESGSRKSETVDAIAFPLRDYEAVLAQSAAAEIAAAKATRAIDEKRLEHLQTTAAKAKNAMERDALTREAGELAAGMGVVPSLPRLLADDVTPERLAGILADNGGACAIHSPEGGIFSIMAGRYSDKQVNLDLILKAHAGDEVRVDRQGRPSEFIKRPALSLGLAVQPDVLASLSDTPSFRGRGLLGRFLYSLPLSLAGTRRYQDRPLDPQARRAYARAVERILDLPDAGTEEDPTLRHSPPLTGEALTLWAEFADAVEARQADGEDLAGVRDWASKLAGAVARVAGGFHLVEHAGGNWQQPLEAETVAAAWAVGEYLIPHALAAFGQMSADPRLTLARRILGWIERKKLAEFTLRDCQQAHKGGQALLTAEELLPALTVLVDRSYIRAEPAPPGAGTVGRPGSQSYAVNPATHDANPAIQEPGQKSG